MWYVVAVGALINMLLIWMFDLRLRTHLLLGGLISFFTGTMICLIVLLIIHFVVRWASRPRLLN